MTDPVQVEILRQLCEVVKVMTSTVDKLIIKIDIFMDLYRRSVPVWIVVLMFSVLLGAIFGKEAIEWFFDSAISPGGAR